MKCETPMNKYSLVFCVLRKPIMQLGEDGFFHEIGKARGVLVKSVHDDYQTWYHRPEDYLDWKPHLKWPKSS